jgi:hypothetical protein
LQDGRVAKVADSTKLLRIPPALAVASQPCDDAGRHGISRAHLPQRERQPFALLRHAQGSRVANEKNEAELCLHALHDPAQGGWRHPQRGRGFVPAPCIGKREEVIDVLESKTHAVQVAERNWREDFVHFDCSGLPRRNAPATVNFDHETLTSSAPAGLCGACRLSRNPDDSRALAMAQGRSGRGIWSQSATWSCSRCPGRRGRRADPLPAAGSRPAPSGHLKPAA